MSLKSRINKIKEKLILDDSKALIAIISSIMDECSGHKPEGITDALIAKYNATGVDIESAINKFYNEITAE